MSKHKSTTAVAASKMSAVERVVTTLRERLAKGDYAPGHHLVESELTEELQVSRSSVREAFRLLAAEGLLTNERNRGIRVRRLSGDDIVALYQVREVLEGLGARLAAGRISECDYKARLRELQKQMKAAIAAADVDGYYALNEALHGLIVEMSGNSYVQQMVEQLRIPAMRLQFRLQNQLERSRRSHDDHQPLIQALLTGDEAGAETAMRQHIRHSGAYVDALIAQTGVPQGPGRA